MRLVIISLSFALVRLQDTLAEVATEALGLKGDNYRPDGV